MKTLLFIFVLSISCYAWQPFCDTCSPNPWFVDRIENEDTIWAGSDSSAYTEWIAYVKKNYPSDSKVILKFQLKVGFSKKELLLVAGRPDNIRAISNKDGNGSVYYYETFIAILINNTITSLQRRLYE